MLLGDVTTLPKAERAVPLALCIAYSRPVQFSRKLSGVIHSRLRGTTMPSIVASPPISSGILQYCFSVCDHQEASMMSPAFVESPQFSYLSRTSRTPPSSRPLSGGCCAVLSDGNLRSCLLRGSSSDKSINFVSWVIWQTTLWMLHQGTTTAASVSSICCNILVTRLNSGKQ